MWWCFPVASGYIGVMEDTIVVLTWRSAAKPVSWHGWPSTVKALLFIHCARQSEWCGMISYSSILSSLVSAVCKMTVSTIYVSCFRHTMWNVLKSVCHIQMCCWRTQCCQYYCSVIYSYIVLLHVFIWCGSVFIWIGWLLLTIMT